MNNTVVSDNIKIENMIYEIRGKQVMLDSDLADLYGCKNGTYDHLPGLNLPDTI